MKKQKNTIYRQNVFRWKNAEKIYYGKPIIYDSNKTDETQNSVILKQMKQD